MLSMNLRFEIYLPSRSRLGMRTGARVFRLQVGDVARVGGWFA